MSSYRLKKNQESFTTMSGEYAGRTFRRGEVYENIPPGAQRKFEELGDPELVKKIPEKPSNPATRRPGGKQ